MKTEQFTVETGGRMVTDITDRLDAFCRDHGGSGLIHVFLPHATAGLGLMETDRDPRRTCRRRSNVSCHGTTGTAIAMGPSVMAATICCRCS
jgi:hypothetical protein